MEAQRALMEQLMGMERDVPLEVCTASLYALMLESLRAVPTLRAAAGAHRAHEEVHRRHGLQALPLWAFAVLPLQEHQEVQHDARHSRSVYHSYEVLTGRARPATWGRTTRSATTTARRSGRRCRRPRRTSTPTSASCTGSWCVAFLPRPSIGGLIPSHFPYDRHAIIIARGFLRLR
jgi:hypothetical protein